MKSIRHASLKGKRVLLRVDFNILPIKPREPRIFEVIPTIRHLLGKKAKVILITHLETNEGGIPSARILARYLRKKYFPKLRFYPKIFGSGVAKAIAGLKPGEILLLENLRKNPGEKNLNVNFAKKLAQLGDLYVNEAFSVSHRKHSSITLLPKLLPAFCGFLFEMEIKNLSRAFRPSRPFTLILGGGKVETKLPFLRELLGEVDTVLLGGVIANAFLKKKIISSRKIILPEDVVVKTRDTRKILKVAKVKKGDKIFDIGPGTLRNWSRIIRKSRLVVWNGPLGFVEKGFVGGTLGLISILKKSRGKIIIGGGDTNDYLPKKLPKNIFVSTAGGAMLEYLAEKTLPGIKALRK